MSLAENAPRARGSPREPHATKIVITVHSEDVWSRGWRIGPEADANPPPSPRSIPQGTQLAEPRCPITSPHNISPGHEFPARVRGGGP